MVQLIVLVVSVGRSGSRMWPASHDSFSEQFRSLLGRNLSQDTLQRIANTKFASPIVIAATEYRFLVVEPIHGKSSLSIHLSVTATELKALVISH
jgi:mannose-1-phosphate guanylyltransferase